MADLTRRGFLAQVSVSAGVGIASGLGLHQLLANNAPAIRQSATSGSVVSPPDGAETERLPLNGMTMAGPMVLHVRDIASGEIAMMVGTQELIYRDPDLVSRLVQTATSATTAGGGLNDVITSRGTRNCQGSGCRQH